MRHFYLAVDGADDVQSVDGGRETAVQTEDLAVDECSQRQLVEQVGEQLPDVGRAVLLQAFVVEAVDLRDLPGFVVAAQDGESGPLPDFEGCES